MAKVITFAQHFPAGHPRAGQPTHFVRKIYQGFGYDFTCNSIHTQIMTQLYLGNKDKVEAGILTMADLTAFAQKIQTEPAPGTEPQTKLHTVRSGSRWKKGDLASLRVWSAVPYNSTQINLFMDNFPLQNVYPLDKIGPMGWISPLMKATTTIGHIARNDGLLQPDFDAWFPQPFFSGQILCIHKVDY